MRDFFQPFTILAGLPRAEIYELIAPDILHQLIKGVFMDHLVAWIKVYLEKMRGSANAKKIMDDIDRRFVLHSSVRPCME